MTHGGLSLVRLKYLLIGSGKTLRLQGHISWDCTGQDCPCSDLHVCWPQEINHSADSFGLRAAGLEYLVWCVHYSSVRWIILTQGFQWNRFQQSAWWEAGMCLGLAASLLQGCKRLIPPAETLLCCSRYEASERNNIGQIKRPESGPKLLKQWLVTVSDG